MQVQTIDILLADTQPLTKAGLTFLLHSKNDLKIVAEAENKAMLLKELHRHRPCLLITDYHFRSFLQPKDFTELLSVAPELNILVVSSDDHKNSILEVLNTGIQGFLTKDCGEEEIFQAIYSTARGEKFFCHKVFELLMEKNSATPDLETRAHQLSLRESQVLELIGRGFSSMQIADRLHLSIHTINTHRKNIIRKLGINSPTEFVIHALDLGLIHMKY